MAKKAVSHLNYTFARYYCQDGILIMYRLHLICTNVSYEGSVDYGWNISRGGEI